MLDFSAVCVCVWCLQTSAQPPAPCQQLCIIVARLQPKPQEAKPPQRVFYPEEGQVPVLLHVRDLQVLQHHSAVFVRPHHIGIVVVVGADKA